ncbi:hypothetical protein B5X24_HaOG214001 [Helicoverpa armigera]|nr:hypothetical protein B5X24_HaOG214001 [Helicoverpa armigera]
MSGIVAAINELKQLNSTIESSNSSQQEDEYDVVGKHVAIQLRQLPLLDFLDAKDENSTSTFTIPKKSYIRSERICFFLIQCFVTTVLHSVTITRTQCVLPRHNLSAYQIAVCKCSKIRGGSLTRPRRTFCTIY